MSHGSTPAVEVELKMQVPPDRLGDVIETLERLVEQASIHYLPRRADGDLAQTVRDALGTSLGSRGPG